MHIPHLYAFAGRPERGAAAVRHSLETRYANAADGLPDDEDMGCHSAFYICNAIGLYPIYGRTLYSVVPPLFEEAVLQYGRTGKTLTIRRRGDGLSVKALLWNGAPRTGTLIEHRDIGQGGLLEVVTG